MPRLCLFAVQNIGRYQEIRYDYDAPDLWWRVKYVCICFMSLIMHHCHCILIDFQKICGFQLLCFKW